MKKVAKKAAKKVAKKVAKKPAKKTKQPFAAKMKPATVQLSPVHGTAGAIIPVPSARLFTNTRRDARIAFSDKNS